MTSTFWTNLYVHTAMDLNMFISALAILMDDVRLLQCFSFSREEKIYINIYNIICININI